MRRLPCPSLVESDIRAYNVQMAAAPRLRSRRPSSVLLAAAFVLCGLLALTDVVPAAAQGWLGGLFGGGQPQGGESAPAYPSYGHGPNSYAPRRRPPRHKPPSADQTQAQDPAAKPPAPKAATVFVEVFGDSLGQLLANGLDEALADKPEVGVVHMARGPSGLVNEAYYDWPKAIDDLLARQGKRGQDKLAEDKLAQDKPTQGKPTQDKPAGNKAASDKTVPAGQPPGKQNQIDVAVMMIGSNDRQPIVQDGVKLQPGSEEWNAIYRKRVIAIAEAFQKKKIPLIWVGVPIVKDDDFADDMAALNDIYREAAARTGAAYVDTWEAFSDDNGDFSAYGPDINGQTVRLRSADGIYFTKAGARKLAHFVEAQVRRDLDGKTPLPQLPTDAPATVAKDKSKDGKPVVALVKPDAGPIKNLGEPPAAKDGHLENAPGFGEESARDAIVANTLIKGQPEAAPPGRADDFRWPSGGTAAR